MTAPRRRILRPAAVRQVAGSRRHTLRQRQLVRLAKEQQAFETWMRRLRRAFHAIERIQGRIARLQRQLGAADAA